MRWEEWRGREGGRRQGWRERGRGHQEMGRMERRGGEGRVDGERRGGRPWERMNDERKGGKGEGGWMVRGGEGRPWEGMNDERKGGEGRGGRGGKHTKRSSRIIILLTMLWMLFCGRSNISPRLNKLNSKEEGQIQNPPFLYPSLPPPFHLRELYTSLKLKRNVLRDSSLIFLYRQERSHSQPYQYTWHN